MSKNVAVFVDVANLYYSARGQDVDVDYVALLKAATKGRDLIRAYAYSGLDPENENQRKFIDFLGKNGYKVMTKDIRKFGDGRVKANLDIELVVDLLRLSDRMDIAVIVSGDGDFAPAIRALQDKGVRCEVISFRPNTSSDLMAVTDEFTDIMKIAGIGRNSKEAKAQRGMSAPEMPAKEVVPEFGFREASPSVAKAALAAIKDGREVRSSDGDRSRRRRRAPAAEGEEQPATPTEATAGEEPSEAAAAAAVGADGEPRRRRRRRGGRGRGRGRGRAEHGETAGDASGDNGEIGWVEVDDLSELADLEGISDLDQEREYTFEEADEATLAELGLAAAPTASTATEAAADAEPKKPARRSRAKKATADEAATAAAAEGEPKKPARRRTATRKPPAKKAEDEATPAATRPRARRATSRTAESTSAAEGANASAAEAGDGEEQEGIWKRFRSARGSKTTS